MQLFFGALISVLYEKQGKENYLKHFTVYEEAEKLGRNILKEAFRLSLEFSNNATGTRNFEKRVLQLSLQVPLS